MGSSGYVLVVAIHPFRTRMLGSFESVRWNAHVQTRPRFILSSERVLGEWSQNPYGQINVMTMKGSITDCSVSLLRRKLSPTH